MHSECTDCPLHKTASRMVWGEGAPGGRVAIVGQGPGRQEDRIGSPFIGPSGALLDACLSEVGLNRDDVYITNLVKCLTPENRAPAGSEIKACRHHLDGEMAEVNPKALVLLGSHSTRALCGQKLQSALGVQLEAYERPAFAAYHPAYVLRGNTWARATITSALRSALRADTEEKETAWDTTLFTEWHNVCAVDVETSRTENDALLSVATSWGDSTVVMPVYHGENPDGLDGWTIQESARFIFHNGPFDLEVLEDWYDTEEFGSRYYWDTMVAQALIDENEPKSLKYLAEKELGARPYAIDTAKLTSETDWDHLAAYNAKDASYTYRLWEKQRQHFVDEPRLGRLMVGLVMPAARALYRAHRRGLKVDREYTQKRLWGLEEELDAASRRLCGVVDADPGEANWQASSNFFRNLMKSRFPVLKRTPKGQPSWDVEVLERLHFDASDEHDRVLLNELLTYRGLYKLKTAFLSRWLEWSEKTGRIHPRYNVSRGPDREGEEEGTVTGRISSSKPNCQQIPREPDIRRCFIADEGKVLVMADYGQIELRVASWLAPEPEMLEAFREGRDVHLEMARRVLDRNEVTKEERTVFGKTPDFAFLYGGEAGTLIRQAQKYGYKISASDAAKVHKAFHEQWPGFKEWYARTTRFLQERGYVRTPLGRRRHLPEIDSSDQKIRKRAIKQALNFPVQSFASDLMLMSIIELDSMGYGLVATVHDSGIWEVPEDKAVQAVEDVRRVMCTPGILKKHWPGVKLTVPLDVDVVVGKSWADG